MNTEENIQHVQHEASLFAGWREPAASRDELPARMAAVKTACEGKAIGPLTHIIRFDTPVDGFDSEIGFAVEQAIDSDPIRSHRLRPLHFFSARHKGPVATLRETTAELYKYMNLVGLSAELELVELYHHYDPEDESNNDIEVRASFLAWPEVYHDQLNRVLGQELAEEIWAGGERITPFTRVDERAAWVAGSLRRLKERTDQDQQFDILSRVALVRPVEDVNHYKALFDELGRDVKKLIDLQESNLAADTPSRRFIDPPSYDGKVFHMSKVPYHFEEYLQAKTVTERRKAFCFCTLVREAQDPQIDPIFCYRAAGWARQFWEPILGVEFTRCTITHSILKGDPFCAWDYEMPSSPAS
ncbi:MAG: hypothetical protein PVG63_03545 [Anaerolineales bacterium]